jgi:beta-glucosidase
MPAFPSNFVWGTATSAYQIEGAHDADGKGPSIWDDFCSVPGAIWGGHDAKHACEHYRRMEQDVALLRELGVRAYRFSVSWPRVLPAGVGEVNKAGLDFYRGLADALLEAGITPYCTLFHWDYPSALEARGGWLNPQSPAWFEEYTRVVVDALSDRVSHWMTHNEPQVFLKFGLGDGVNAPGKRLPLREQLMAAHHALLAHGRSVRVIRERAKSTPRVGWAVVCVVKYPASASRADLEAARTATFGSAGRDLWNNAWHNDPVLLGRYPEHLAELFAPDVPAFPASDTAVMKQPLDFLGLNIYEGTPVRAADNAQGWEHVERSPGYAKTAFQWPVAPESLYWGPRFMHERYGLPMYITENGLSSMDWVSMDGKVHDPQRIDFTRRYLLELRRASADGVDIRGYFHWSFMDNFEWAAGYRERFGLVHVDYATQQRTPKDSFAWYRKVIESNGASLDADPFARG